MTQEYLTYIINPMLLIREWHEAVNQPRIFELNNPAERQNLIRLRATLIEEEFAEVIAELKALYQGEGDIARLAKELADLAYVVYGTADVFGIPLDEVFEVVDANNKTKIDPETGRVKKRADGKVEKPEWYKPISLDEIRDIINSY